MGSFRNNFFGVEEHKKGGWWVALLQEKVQKGVGIRKCKMRVIQEKKRWFEVWKTKTWKFGAALR